MKSYLYLISFVFAFFPSLFAYSKEKTSTKKNRPTIESDRQIIINYGSAPWNLNSVRIDSAYIFVRDARTEKVFKILLEESAPDSSIFSGKFSLGLAPQTEVQPEVYIPPRNMRDDETAVSKFSALLQQKKIKRMPTVFWRDKDHQYLEVFDTREQALRAHEAYKERSRLERDEKNQAREIDPVPNEQTLKVAKAIKLSEEEKLQALLAAKRETERVRLEQLERQRLEAKKRELEQLAQSELDKRKREASQLAAEAMVKYQAGDFKQAEDLFRKANEKDPHNKNFYYSYGVALYKNDKFNEALVILKLADSAEVNSSEKLFYMGLCHYRLKEYPQALGVFAKAQALNDPNVGPSSSFYSGAIYFEQKKWDEARKAFEVTLDTSKDPKLDEQAEAFIEQIAQMQAFEEERSKRFIVSGLLGLNYDSNILLVPDSGPGTAQDKAGVRGLGSVGISYRPIYEQKHELHTKLNTLSMYTLNSDFHKADPTMVTLSVPYTYKGELWGKGFIMEASPTYEKLFMDPNNTGTQENILDSISLSNNHTFVMRDTWISIYGLELRKDDSKLADSVGINDASAMKYTLKTNQMLFLDGEKKRALVGDLSLILNDAKGSEKKYYRYEIGFGYIKPIMWDMNWNTRLGVYHVSYPDESNQRKEDNVSFTSGTSKKLSDWAMAVFSFTYTTNSANTSTNSYDKFSIMSALVFNYGI